VPASGHTVFSIQLGHLGLGFFNLNIKVNGMKLFKTSAVLMTSMLMFAGSAFAEAPVCGEAQDDSWLAPEVMQEQVEALGYTVEAMEVSEGNCYQMTGMNADGKPVTAFFDPRTGAVVQEDMAE